MWITEEMLALAFNWLALTALVVWWTVKIAVLLRRQHRAEIAFRIHLARTVRAARIAAASGSPPSDAGSR